MVKAISERTAAVMAGKKQGQERLSVVPILGPSHDEPAYRLLEREILNAVRVTEISESGNVPVLQVVNELDEIVYLMDGQELIGAKQNRILNTDVLVPAKTTLEIPVSCVEQGRWGYNRPEFSPGKSANLSVRRNKMERVKGSLRRRRRHDADQGAVWDEVADCMRASGSSSPTGALSDAYAQRQEDLDSFRRDLQLPDEAVGLAVYQNGRFLGLDLFDKHATLVYFWASLLDSYAIEFLGPSFDPRALGAHPLEMELAELMRLVESGEWEGFDAPGLGRDYRLEHERLSGASLVWEERVVVHMQLFPRPEQNRDEPEQQTMLFRPRVRRRYRPRPPREE